MVVDFAVHRPDKEDGGIPNPHACRPAGAYYGARNAGAWSNKGKVGNLQTFADAVNYLTGQKLYTVDAARRRQEQAHTQRRDRDMER